MRIRAITAAPISYRVPEGQNVTLGIGRAVKRDAVLVKVETDEGMTGWGGASRSLPGRHRQADRHHDQ